MSSAWKVAYADFVTALMAFFFLMWILNMTPPETKKGLASYFAEEALLDSANASAISNNALINRTDKLDLSEAKMSELERSHYIVARKLKAMLMQDGILRSASGLSADDVGVQLRISNDVLFKPGSAEFSPPALKVLDDVLSILREYNLYLVIRGHADSEEATGSPYPSGWELSAARAAAATRYLAEKGVVPTRMRAVGYGDTRPLEPGNSVESHNRNRRLEFHFHRPDAMAYSIVY